MTLSDHVTYHCELKTNVVYVQYFKHRFLQVLCFFLNLGLGDLILYKKDT